MREAVIVSTARTPIGKAYRGACNNTPSQTLAGHAIEHAVKRAGVDPAEVDDVVMGAAMQQGVQGGNIGRQAALKAGLPVTTSGMSLDRQCASGMMAIATAAKQVVHDHMPVCVGGGVESISMVQTPEMRVAPDMNVVAKHPNAYIQMIDTAELVAKRYGVTREAQDEYAFQSQQRTHAAQQAGAFDAEIVPLASTMMVKDKESGEISKHDVMLEKDEGNRPGTTLEGLNGLKPVRGPEAFITAGNASQLSDGASVSVLMEGREAERRGLEPLGIRLRLVLPGRSPETQFGANARARMGGAMPDATRASVSSLLASR